MPTPRDHRRHRRSTVKPDRVRALELLDGCGDEGCTKAMLCLVPVKKNSQRVTERGQPTDWAEDTLHALQSSLRVFEAHRRLIVSQMDAE
jgi:hypothetical protein